MRIEETDRCLRQKLWGYPELLNEFHKKVKPELASLHEKNMHGEAERRSNGAMERTSNSFPLSHGDELEEESNIGGSSSQTNSNTTGTPDVIFVPQITAEPDVQPEGQLQLENPPPTLDEHRNQDNVEPPNPHGRGSLRRRVASVEEE